MQNISNLNLVLIQDHSELRSLIIMHIKADLGSSCGVKMKEAPTIQRGKNISPPELKE